VIEVMQDLSAQYPRFGYRRIHIYLDRAGHKVSIERAHRLWRLAELQVPRRKSKKRAASGRPRPTPATGVNQVWAYDFVFDACANGQQLKCLTLIDEYTREALAIDVQGSLRSGRLIEILSQLISVHGAPMYLRSDNGPEFVCNATAIGHTRALVIARASSSSSSYSSSPHPKRITPLSTNQWSEKTRQVSATVDRNTSAESYRLGAESA
jgi:transposase InsO family protein